MKYLITKIESRSKIITKIQQFFYSIISFENLYLNKRKFLNKFSKIKDDFQQISCAIKDLFNDNKALYQF